MSKDHTPERFYCLPDYYYGERVWVVIDRTGESSKTRHRTEQDARAAIAKAKGGT